MEANTTDRIKGWKEKWDENDIGFHKSDVHNKLQEHSSLLFGEVKSQKFFVPLCGKTLDLKWLSDKGHTVVGLDGVRKSLEDFCNEQGLEQSEEDAPNMGPGCQVFKIKNRQMNLYLGDFFLFNKSCEGQFDCIWDRGSLVALDRKDVKAYAALIKDLLKPGGKMLVEVFEYDLVIFADIPFHPPPYPVFEDEMKSLYEPECTLEVVDRVERQVAGKDVGVAYYLVVKK